jgi:serine protease Do
MKKLSYFIVSLLLVLTLVFGTGCSIIANQAVEEETPVAENITADEPDVVIEPTGSAQSLTLPNITDVVARVKPSVVSINTEYTITDFFNRQSTQEAAGSGWIITKDGYIVTNNHVVEDAEKITVMLDNGEVYDAEIIGLDPITDLAVIKIDADNLPAASVGATQGIVSRTDVSLQVDASQVLYGLIETDAAINPGNSGGPLVNLAGEVIGINSVKQVQVEVEGVGYAISTEEGLPIIEELINYGEASHPYLGVSLYPVDKYLINAFDLDIDHGVFLVEVGKGSPADEAGLKPQDIILEFDGEEIETMDDLIIAIRSAEIGQEVKIVYWRDNEEKTTTATLEKRPNG